MAGIFEQPIFTGRRRPSIALHACTNSQLFHAIGIAAARRLSFGEIEGMDCKTGQNKRNLVCRGMGFPGFFVGTGEKRQHQ